jgi:hypothetical protein
MGRGGESSIRGRLGGRGREVGELERDWRGGWVGKEGRGL